MTDLAVQQWLIEVSGYDDQHVIRANPKGPKPEGEHITYLRMTNQTSQYADISKTDLFVDDDIQVDYSFSDMQAYSINVYSHTGSDLLSELWRSRYLLVPRVILRDAGMVLWSKSEPVTIPQPGDTTWLPQYNATFSFGTFAVSSEVNQKILEYELYGKFEDDEILIDDQF
jgi:hypothetical protein